MTPRAHLAGTRRERLNDLSGREWIRFTKSWFIANPPRRSRAELLHPAKFPEELCESFVQYFTRAGMWVFDPFAGTGSTLIAALRHGRKAVGIEIHPGFARLAKERVQAAGYTGTDARVIVGDSRELARIWVRAKLPDVQLVLTSPPYWDMLGKSRGGSRSAHRDRASAGLSTTYSLNPKDLGNLHHYEAFLASVVDVLRSTGKVLSPGRYLVVVAQNLRDVDGRIRTLAWDIARELDRPPFQFQGERIWCQDSKPLGIWGYPSTFVPNYHHHYCLVFRRSDVGPRATSGPRSGGPAPRDRTASGAPRRDAAG